ncbi:prepilin-type N-terminal cleavage/methylation domain-containing protein [Campylobacter ureolyticus]|uniref:prepilin-type N-terminal cleavage/methylation domain-containing protein n=1 Tax=Campylobacter ureolyticus TaxID=827 RepID=UPI0022B2BD72|nr:prepilin-type N-terminal cleavage/methylation domain-containing protein [Campylobacter ureolyticus]MCZ6169316.1 prepilin-type N-terminal cleavage/methylation domain-containing protein [Campylobacter ureolyticus]
MNKKAFTMIELVFVIVILGILAGVAIPRLSVTRDDATMAKVRADLASIRSGIALDKSKAMMEGRLSEWKKDVADLANNNFSSVVQGGIKPGNANNGWTFSGTTATACIAKKCAEFELVTTGNNAGDFNCKKEKGNCNLFE